MRQTAVALPMAIVALQGCGVPPAFQKPGEQTPIRLPTGPLACASPATVQLLVSDIQPPCHTCTQTRAALSFFLAIN